MKLNKFCELFELLWFSRHLRLKWVLYKGGGVDCLRDIITVWLVHIVLFLFCRNVVCTVCKSQAYFIMVSPCLSVTILCYRKATTYRDEISLWLTYSTYRNPAEKISTNHTVIISLNQSTPPPLVKNHFKPQMAGDQRSSNYFPDSI